MRDDALEPAQLNDRDLSVCDVGGGTGFCTQGIVKHVDPKNVTLLDQSPQQLSKARAKKDLEGVTIIEGDAEDLPFETDSFDRCVRYPTYSLPLLSLSSLCCFFSRSLRSRFLICLSDLSVCASACANEQGRCVWCGATYILSSDDEHGKRSARSLL